MLSFFSYSLGEIKLVYSNKRLPLSIKTINIVQTYPHINESFSCILKIFVMIFLFPMNFFNYLGIYSTPNLSKYVVLLSFTYKANQGVASVTYSSRFIIYALSSLG